uniref:Uncharacterized protein n=1 Tax=Caenorhabditis japonica TaxID=281687 RepID=A0A8R1E9U9_CAEJA
MLRNKRFWVNPETDAGSDAEGSIVFAVKVIHCLTTLKSLDLVTPTGRQKAVATKLTCGGVRAVWSCEENKW